MDGVDEIVIPVVLVEVGIVIVIVVVAAAVVVVVVDDDDDVNDGREGVIEVRVEEVEIGSVSVVEEEEEIGFALVFKSMQLSC